MVLPLKMNRRQKAWGLSIAKRNWDIMLRDADRMSIEPDYWPLHRKRVEFGSMLCLFRRMGHYWTLESFRVVIAYRVGADVCIPHSCHCGGRMDSTG